MRLQSVKTAAETGIPGLEFVTVDKKIVEVKFRGVTVKITDKYSDALTVLMPAPPETATRYEVTAKIAGFEDAVSLHEQEYEARDAAAAHERNGATVDVKQIEVVLDEHGNAIAEVPGASLAKAFASLLGGGNASQRLADDSVPLF